MGNHNIDQPFENSQEEPQGNQIVCILCDGTHGANTWCQADANSAWSN